jgi:DNA-binding TFAR19-related protein (PDSD5 family)
MKPNLDLILLRKLEKDAYERLMRIKMINPQLYQMAVQVILNINTNEKITDDELKSILIRLRGG